MNILNLWTAMALASALTMSAAAQKADLSGTWHLNVSKSFLAAEHPSSDYRLTKIIAQKDGSIEQRDVAMHASMAGIALPDSNTLMKFSTDGKENKLQVPVPFPGMPPMTVVVTAVWQADTLAVTERSNSFFGPATTDRRYFLSTNGLYLIELVEGHNSFGDTEQRLVFDKQP